MHNAGPRHNAHMPTDARAPAPTEAPATAPIAGQAMASTASLVAGRAPSAPAAGAAPALRGISSMATRHILAELGALWSARSGVPVQIESVGGVDAERRVAAGERFDLVFLARDAIDRLLAQGRVTGPRVDVFSADMVAAVPAGAPAPRIDTLEALQRALLAAERIGYSTGPSGTALLALFERWGLMERLRDRLVQARAGVPVAQLVAQGAVSLGFQQRSEMLGAPGIVLLPPLPAEAAICTVFSAAYGHVGEENGRTPASTGTSLLSFLMSEEADPIICRHGMARVASS